MKDVEFKLEIQNVNDLLLLEMKEKVDKAFDLTSNKHVGNSELSIEELKIFKETLGTYPQEQINFLLTDYLKKKIDYVLKSLEK
jgi:hypothetical protein